MTSFKNYKTKQWTKEELVFTIKTLTSGTEGTKINNTPTPRLVAWLLKFWGESEINEDYYAEAFVDSVREAHEHLSQWKLWEVARWGKPQVQKVVNEVLNSDTVEFKTWIAPKQSTLRVTCWDSAPVPVLIGAGISVEVIQRAHTKVDNDITEITRPWELQVSTTHGEDLETLKDQVYQLLHDFEA